MARRRSAPTRRSPRSRRSRRARRSFAARLRRTVLGLGATAVLAGCTAAFAGSIATGAFVIGPVPSTVPPEPTTVATTQPPATTVPEPPTTAAPPVTVPPLGRVIERGMAGDDVAMVQQRLRDLGFDPGDVDGRYGTSTIQSVWAFQHLMGARGAEADGLVTPELWQRMGEPLGAVPKRPDAGDHVEIDKDAQVLVLWEAGVAKVITHISTGSGERYCESGRCGVAVTPPGEFAFTWRYPGWRTSWLGRLYNPVYFNGGIAVHGALDVPNHPASHGCVRIPMHIAEYFPSLVQQGDPVLVYQNGTTARA